MKEKRILFPVGNQYFQESAWVELADGSRSRKPVSGQPKVYDKLFIEQEVAKGNVVIDNSMAIVPGNSAYAPTTTGIAQEEHGQYELTLQAGAGGGVVRIGLDDTGLPIFGGTAAVQDVTVGGTHGVNTIKAIGRLAFYGKLKLKKLHFEASSADVFSETPRLKEFSSVGECKLDKKVYYPKATSEDDNKDIRTMTEQYLATNGLNLMMDGMNYLEIAIPANESVNLTLYTCFIK
ncbi:hypothetical protein [Aureispira sp. CCB-QB1]|uniref:hypothetical protein n=1 Tax=Aureispira sp. CCB-QB1 TaxID=1313421 RepID=UPI000697582B|nr:hypothetical protein [Aureispira sp. CCB-QB1]